MTADSTAEDRRFLPRSIAPARHSSPWLLRSSCRVATLHDRAWVAEHVRSGLMLAP